MTDSVTVIKSPVFPSSLQMIFRSEQEGRIKKLALLSAAFLALAVYSRVTSGRDYVYFYSMCLMCTAGGINFIIMRERNHAERQKSLLHSRIDYRASYVPLLYYGTWISFICILLLFYIRKAF